MRTLLCIILFLGMTGQIFAQEPVAEEEEEEVMISADRPGITFSPTTVPKGYEREKVSSSLWVVKSFGGGIGAQPQCYLAKKHHQARRA